MSAPTKPPLFSRIRIAAFILAGLFLVAIFEPHTLRFIFKRAILLQAARHGVSLRIDSVQGSLFKPILLKGVSLKASCGPMDSDIQAGSAKLNFSWRALLPFYKGGAFFNRISLDRTQADFTFRPRRDAFAGEPNPAATQPDPWFPAPARVEVANSNVIFHMSGRKVTFADVRFTISPLEPGVIAIEKLTFENKHASRSFNVLRGTTALQGARWRVADLNLCDGVVLTNLSSNLDDMVKGKPQVDFDFAAFGGSIRGDLLKTAGHPGEPDYEITGAFSNISVEALAKFLHGPEAAGGTIKEGKFTFQGSPYELENATVSTRFEATDFRWDHRQWNSLVMGATIVNRRVQIPELKLQQAHNTLELNGEIHLPEDPQTPWWLTDFNFNIAAKINKLSELSALFGPQFADASGIMTVDGSIRGNAGKSYSGQLIVAGNKLTWRGVPFDLLNAGIKLDGNELQIINLEAVHGRDFVRGKGSVTILGPRRYKGELNASIDELAIYKPLLQKPIVPAPLGGGLNVTWSGDGTTGAHSGAFSAHFRKLCKLGADDAPGTLPIDADLEGTYAPGGLSVNQCVLANGDTRLEGRIAADEKTLTLQGLKLMQKKTLWMEGDATLPFNLFHWWVNPSLAALDPDAPLKAQLTAKGVQLEEVAHLTGRPIPIRGILSGTLQTASTLRTLSMTGSIKLSKGQLPASEFAPALEKLEAEADIDGNVLRFSKLSASHPNGDFSATGSLDLSKFDTPKFDLLLHCGKVRFNAGPAWSGTAKLDLSITGTRNVGNATGTAEILTLEAPPRPDFGALISSGTPETIGVPAPVITIKPPFDQWSYHISAATAKPLPLPSSKKATLAADLHLDGTGAALTATGNLTFADLPAVFPQGSAKLESGDWYLGPEPKLIAHLTGTLQSQPGPVKFDGYYLGTPSAPTPVFWGDTPEETEQIDRVLAPTATPGPGTSGTNPGASNKFSLTTTPEPSNNGAQAGSYEEEIIPQTGELKIPPIPVQAMP